MSHSRRGYESAAGRPNRTSPPPGQGGFTGQAAEPGAGESPGLGEQELGAEQKPAAAAESGQPQYREGYSVIAPNVSRRSQLQQMANKELEELKQWKEAHRPGPINMTPTQLGGFTSEAEARRRQQINLRGSKLQQRAKKEEYDRKRKEAEELEYQKKKEIQREKTNQLAEKRRQEDEQRKAQLQAEHQLANQQFLQRIDANRSYSQSHLPPNYTVPTTSRAKKEEYDRKRKEAEELEYQKKKEIQREKANQLTEKRRQEDEQRKAQLQAEHQLANQQFLQRIDANRSYSQSHLPPNYTVPATSRARSHNYWETQREAEQQKLQELKEEQRKKSDLLTEKESQLEAEKQKWLQEEHRRKNNAFLDNLERRRQPNENSHRFTPPLSDEESFEHDTKQYVAASTFYEDLKEDEQDSPEAMIRDATCRGSPEGTCGQWDLMKLQCCFPDYDVAVLEELLLQCDGDYERLAQLLQ